MKEEIIKNKVKTVIVSIEASDRTKEKFKKICQMHNVPLIIDGNIDELSKSIGKENKAIFGVKDVNLGNEIKRIYDGGEIIG